MNKDTQELLLNAFTHCRDWIAYISHLQPPGPAKEDVADYLHMLTVILRSIKALEMDAK